jgi:hypothetical protein
MRKIGKALLALAFAVPGVLLTAGPAHAAFDPGNGQVAYIREYAGNNKCLDVRAAGTGNGTLLQRWDCGPQWNQQFIFMEPGYQTGRLSWKIKPRYLTNKCVDAKDGLHASTPVQIWDCNSGWQQRWVIVPGAADFYELRAAYDLNYCLDIPSSGNGWTAYISRCDGTFGQVWSP